MSDDPLDGFVDAGTRRFLAELRDLVAGRSTDSGEVRVVIASQKGRRSGPRQYAAALFSADAQRGDRALLITELEPSALLDDIAAGSLVTYYGVLEVGHAVAIAVGDELYFPLGAATRSVLLMPKAKW